MSVGSGGGHSETRASESPIPEEEAAERGARGCEAPKPDLRARPPEFPSPERGQREREGRCQSLGIGEESKR